MKAERKKRVNDEPKEILDMLVEREMNLGQLLTYSMVHCPSWEANWFAASQEISRILWNPKVHYCTHKRPPPVPILGQPNPVHTPTSLLLEIHRNIIYPSTPRSPQWSLSLQFPHQDPIHPLSSSIRATRTILGVQYKSFSSNLGQWYCLFFFYAMLRVSKVTYAPTQVSDILVLSHTYTTSRTVSLTNHDKCRHKYTCFAINRVINSDMMTHAHERFFF